MNNQKELNKKEKKPLWPVGTRVELISTTDPYTTLSEGSRGTVSSVDSRGTVFIQWDEGSGLGLIPGEDKWKVVEGED